MCACACTSQVGMKQLPNSSFPEVKAGAAAVRTAATRVLAALTEAIHNADVGRAIELQLLVRELAWYGRPEMAEGLPLQGPDYLLLAATVFSVTASLFLCIWLWRVGQLFPE